MFRATATNGQSHVPIMRKFSYNIESGYQCLQKKNRKMLTAALMLMFATSSIFLRFTIIMRHFVIVTFFRIYNEISDIFCDGFQCKLEC